MVSVPRPAVFLDRDGVLNSAEVVDGTPMSPRSIDEVTILPGVDDACRQLRDSGLVLVMVTNQPDISRGLMARDVVDGINEHIRQRLSIDSVAMCPHDDVDQCACRKPLPGMIVNSADELNLDLSRSVMVGDRWKDVAAGKAAGVATVFVDHRYGETEKADADHVVGGLLEAVPFILHLTTAGGITSCPV